MTETEKILCLERENTKLKEDNEMLMEIIAQMKVTLNRLVNRYMIENNPEKVV